MSGAIRARIESWPADVQREAWPTWIGSRARSDPTAAVEALAEISDASVRRRARPALVDGWSSSGDPGLWRYLSEVSDGRVRSELAEAALHQRLWQGDAATLIREIENLPVEPPMDRFKGELLALTAGILQIDDLPRAMALAEAHRDTPYGGEITARVAAKWASRDGAAAMAWLLDQPADERRRRALARAHRHWLRSDEPIAVAWLEDRVGDEDLTSLVIAYTAALAQRDLDAATEWADLIPVRDVRDRALLVIESARKRKDRTNELGEATRRPPRG